MTYRLNFPTDVFDTYKQLPELARRDLALALVDAQQDPLAYSELYGQDDGIIRTVVAARLKVSRVGDSELAIAHVGERNL
ncbi:hypothetical protein [Streptomyces griseus]|uniref:hypothetical protein n=1 Tax=Streptomyces griseus TaxID=1911 RepID=UPI003824644A